MTTGETETALASLLAAIAAQRALVSDAERRGPPPGSALYRSAFALVDDAALAAARRVAADPAAPAPLKTAAGAFARDAEEAACRRVHVAEHLLSLARGWQCRACHEDVPQAAFLAHVAGGASRVRVDIVCKACGQRSAATGAGQAHFDRVFGPLVDERWNPEAHGFQWDRR
ncbi:MAG: hypothetical protein FJ137_20335 [Deltaproteobacteria bacterium]|nr:hypothetical protein [Deltaproteobacteria bacterium]